MSRTAGSRNTRAQHHWAGAGLAVLAGVGATVGLLVAGGPGIALGGTLGAALGLMGGAIVDAWSHRNQPGHCADRRG